MKIKKNALIHSYTQSMGIKAAKDLITEKINSAALEEKELYTEEETAKIYGELIKEGGLIGIVAQNLVVQLERKRSEEQTLLLDNIEHQIWYLTDKETYGVVNKAHAKFLGLEKEELEEKDLYDIIGVEEADICIANNREVFEKKKQSHTEEWIKNGRGDTCLLSITRTPKLNGNGDVEYVICAAEDITERKRAVEALWESEGKLNAMLQSIGDHMSMMDKDLNIIWANKIAKEVFGNDIIGKKCYETYHQRKEPCEPYPCITIKAFQDGKIHEHDTQVIDKDGKKIFFHCTANVALKDKEGKPTAVLEISRNTTEHKQAELALIERGKELENKAQELEEVNAALRVLLKHRDEDKKDLEDKVVANVKKLVLPYVEKLNNSQLNDRQMVYLNIIKSNLEDIITPFLHQLSSKYSDLTPSEIQVAGFVKEGKTTKEMAELLNSSTGAINFHRNNLRKKLGLRNTKTNLRSFLLPLS